MGNAAADPIGNERPCLVAAAEVCGVWHSLRSLDPHLSHGYIVGPIERLPAGAVHLHAVAQEVPAPGGLARAPRGCNSEASEKRQSRHDALGAVNRAMLARAASGLVEVRESCGL